VKIKQNVQYESGYVLLIGMQCEKVFRLIKTGHPSFLKQELYLFLLY